MAARTAVKTSFYESGPFLIEEWGVTTTYTAGTDTLSAVTPQLIKIVKTIKGNFDSWTVSAGAYSFVFASGIAKPWVSFIGYGR